ncbi:MAG: hypothetical protein ONB37_09520 [candidate division KSB1 bacterium]|nr:hypothetical protein [candidate division KSB1 bacterium]
MEALKAITTIKDGSISFDGLQKFNNQKVKVLVYLLSHNNSNSIKEQKRRFFKFQGIIESGFMDTSKSVDKIIYER